MGSSPELPSSSIAVCTAIPPFQQNRQNRDTSMTVNNENRPVWDAAFSEEARVEQLSDDSSAWRAVTGLLLAIISLGLTMALFTAWMCS
jgi:hypothetical protein